VKRTILYPADVLERALDRQDYPEKWCKWCGAALLPKLRTNGRLEGSDHFRARETCSNEHSAKLRAWRERVQTTGYHSAPAEPYPDLEAAPDGDMSVSVLPPSVRKEREIRATLFERLGPRLFYALQETLRRHSPEILDVWGSDPKLQALDYPDDGAAAAFRPAFAS
jgi:hypothetical protein